MALNWTQFNVPTIIAVLGVGWGVANYISKIDSRLATVEEYRITRSAITDKKFEELAFRVSGFQDIPYRVGIIEKGLDEAGKRQDRLSELVLNNMENIRKDVSAVGTKVEVISSKLDDILPQRKAELREPYRVPVQN